MELLTRKEVARMLKISTSTLDRMRRGERFPHAVMAGKRLRWEKTAIRKWSECGQL